MPRPAVPLPPFSPYEDSPPQYNIIMAGQSLDPKDIIFSCVICQKYPSQVYGEPNQALGLNNEPIPKLYMTSCSHVVCSIHFENGGVPFPAPGTGLQAVCPFCESTHRDASLKDLYVIYGTGPGQHDARIPEEYFDTPPAKLTEPGMDAVRYQYVSMLRFSRGTYASLLKTTDEIHQIRDKFDMLVNDLTSGYAGEKTILAKIVRSYGGLEHAENRLQTLQQDVTPEINRLSFNDIIARDRQRANDSTNIKGQSSLAQGSAIDLRNLTNLSSATNRPGISSSTHHQPASLDHGSKQSSSAKRKYFDTSDDSGRAQANDDIYSGNRGITSRDVMPPPQSPVRNVEATHALIPRLAPDDDEHNQLLELAGAACARVSGDPGISSSNDPFNAESPIVKHTHARDGRIRLQETGRGNHRERPMPHDYTQAPNPYSLLNQNLRKVDTNWAINESSKRSDTAAIGPALRHIPHVDGISLSEAALAQNRMPKGLYTGISNDPTPERAPAYQRSPYVFNTNQGSQRSSARPTNDGELDQMLHHPAPRRPAFRTQLISPERRITLPITPRNTASSIARRDRGTGGLLSHARTSRPVANFFTPSSTGFHRQQLGQSGSSANAYQSAYAALPTRNNAYARQPMQSPFFTERMRPGHPNQRARGAAQAAIAYPRRPSAPRQEPRMPSRVLNELSFLEEPALNEGNMGKRRKANR